MADGGTLIPARLLAMRLGLARMRRIDGPRRAAKEYNARNATSINMDTTAQRGHRTDRRINYASDELAPECGLRHVMALRMNGAPHAN
jgi:hypothetical protein